MGMSVANRPSLIPLRDWFKDSLSEARGERGTERQGTVHEKKVVADLRRASLE